VSGKQVLAGIPIQARPLEKKTISQSKGHGLLIFLALQT